MRRIIMGAAALLAALALSGCGGAGTVDALRAELEGARAVAITAEVASLGEGRLGEWTLSLSRSPDALAVTVLAPEEFAGARAVYSGEGRSLEFEGLVLDMGAGAVSAVDALPLVLEAVESGYEALAWSEEDSEFASLQLTDDLGVTLRLEGGVPVWAEILSGGESAVQCDISEFTID